MFRVAAVSNKDAHQDSTLDGLNCLYFCDTRFCADMEKLLSRNEGIKALVRVALCAEIPSIRRLLQRREPCTSRDVFKFNSV